jgi:hypothetical protein
MSCQYRTLLIAETIPIAAIRALPGNPVAGHSPYIFMHASLAHTETATATPTEWHC